MAKEREKKTIELPSGITVEIQKPGLMGLRNIHSVLPIMDPARMKAVRQGLPEGAVPDEMLDGMIRVACVMSINPKLSDLDPTPPGQTSLDDLTQEDALSLIQQATEFYFGTEAAPEEEPDPLPTTTG